ncbi:MAG: hypothetical protein L0Y35_00540, partial [Flammeovirgaceae bacterium]|nr:hypothetical protein [Flammeovirgaceae bacterium]
TSWTPNCFGCHLSMEANRKMPMLHNEETYYTDHMIWEYLAYCAGTGGSILIIGSAAGVAAMGMEKIDFIWYLKRISLLAMLGYFAGAIVYLLIYPYLAVHPH